MTLYFFPRDLSDTQRNVRPSSVWLALPAGLSLIACYAELPGSAPDDPFDGLDAGFVGGGIGGSPSGTLGGPAGGSSDSDIDVEADAGGDGAVASCDGAALGASQSRTRYAEAQVVSPVTCKGEAQTRTCRASGSWSAWTGTFAAEQCTVTSVRSCGSTAHGDTQTRTRYRVEKATDYNQCTAEEQTATCTDGTLSAFSGTAMYESCEVGLSGKCAVLSDVDCEDGTECIFKLLGSQCLGSAGHSCSVNSECVYACVGAACTSAKVPRGGTCDDAADCVACASTGGQSQGTAASCTGNVCACANGSTCSANNQCVGTCVASQCVAANTTCDKDDDCRGESKCIKSGSGSLATGQCKLPDGKACTENTQCEHVCRAQVCGAPAGQGGSCEKQTDCAQGLSCAEVLGTKFCVSTGGHGAQCSLLISGALQCASGVCECPAPDCDMNQGIGMCQ